MLQSFVPSLSTYSHQIDNLFMLVFYIMGFWFFLGQGFIIYCLIKFKRKEATPALYITGEKAEETKWIKRPHTLLLAFDIIIVIFAISAWYNIKQRLPETDYTVKIISQQWAWTFVHPGADGKIDTDDDIPAIDELHIEVNKAYEYKLTTTDVLHSFSVPVFRLKQDAIPGREITGWFKATGTGSYDIQCAEICGIGHGLMAAKIFIETPEEHKKWIAKNTPTTPIKLGVK